MKTATSVLLCVIIVCSVAAKETSNASHVVAPNTTGGSQRGSESGGDAASKAAEPPPIVLSPYIVREDARRTGASQWLPTPEGKPALSGRRFLDALQTGNLLPHVGAKLSTGVVTHGESINGYGRLTLGYHISCLSLGRAAGVAALNLVLPRDFHQLLTLSNAGRTAIDEAIRMLEARGYVIAVAPYWSPDGGGATLKNDSIVVQLSWSGEGGLSVSCYDSAFIREKDALVDLLSPLKHAP